MRWRAPEKSKRSRASGGRGSSTAGCVALPTDQLLALLRWLDPGRAPVIAIGTDDTLTS